MMQLRPLAGRFLRPVVLVATAALLIEVLFPLLLAALAGPRS
jgi:hypothetical protein